MDCCSAKIFKSYILNMAKVIQPVVTYSAFLKGLLVPNDFTEQTWCKSATSHTPVS